MGFLKVYKLKILRIIFTICIGLFVGCAESNNNNEREYSLETTIVNLSTDEYDEYIGRGGEYRTHMLAGGIKPGEIGWLGNPHPIGWCDICGEYHSRTECISKFKDDFYEKIQNDSEFQSAVLALKGKRLGCYCKPEECHGDVIKEWIDSR